MKFPIFLMMPMVALFAFTSCEAQITNSKTEAAKVYGNCSMCEKTIEKAAFIKGEAKVDWDQDTKMAQITYDSSKTNVNAILQRIAAAGYDSDPFTAPDDVYNNLPDCCQYERPKKAEAAVGEVTTPVSEEVVPVAAAPAPKPMDGMVKKQAVTVPVASANPLADVYTAYFSLKDALVSTNGNMAATQAASLSQAIDQVKMGDLSTTQHSVWMKFLPKMSADTKSIKDITDTEKQRTHFVTLSKNMYEVMKVVKPETAVYLDHCPMYNDGKGADWLSKEKGIKNPYYGKQMLTCGSVKEIIE